MNSRIRKKVERREKMKQQELNMILCIIWALTLLYGEMFAYWFPSSFTCSWPDLLRSSSPNSTIQTDNGAYQVHYVEEKQSGKYIKLVPFLLHLELPNFRYDMLSFMQQQ